MADKSHIEWTDATWNPITGCSVVSPGCTNCYAMRLAGTRLQHHPSREGLTTPTKGGPVWNGRVRFNEQWLDQPLRWTARRFIFVCAHGDLFHESVPDEWIDQVFAVMALAPRHVFQVLTKRADRMRAYCSDPSNVKRISLVQSKLYAEKKLIKKDGAPSIKTAQANWPLPNVWLGVSVEDQARADLRLPDLIETPAAVRWISAEPLLRPILIPEYLPHIDWVVAGGESGPGFRDIETLAFHDLLDQCTTHHTPFYMKQMPGKAEIPATLQIREWPGVL